MFQEMRRPHLAMTEAEAWALVEGASFGVLSMNGIDGYPYGVPMTHVVIDGGLVFHAAVTGHRLAALRANPRVCFTVTEGPEEAPDQISPGTMGTYRCAVLFGEMIELPPDQHERSLDAILRRHLPERIGDAERFMQSGRPITIFRMEVAHITGKRLSVQ